MLNLRQGLNLHEVCLTHMTMAYLANFVKKHQLQDVSILLEMHLPHDHLSFQKDDMIVQLFQHKPGDLIWPHIAAFVIDPLRDIQVRRSGKVSSTGRSTHLKSSRSLLSDIYPQNWPRR
jgi:hypothetical protein